MAVASLEWTVELTRLSASTRREGIDSRLQAGSHLRRRGWRASIFT